MINGKFGIIYDLGFINFLITKVYPKLDDENAGEKAMLKDSYVLNHQVVPIKMVEENTNFTNTNTNTNTNNFH